MKKAIIALSLFAFIGTAAVASYTSTDSAKVEMTDTDKKKDKKKKKCASDCAFEIRPRSKWNEVFLWPCTRRKP